MNFENPEPLSFVTPKGEFRYSWLVEPDTKFEKCEYKVEVLVPAEEGMALCEKLEAHLEEWKKACKAQDPNKAWKLVDPQPWTSTTDDAGNPVIKFKCKRKAKGIRKDGTPWEVQLPIFDGKGCMVSNRAPLQKLGAGTLGRVKVQARPYSAPIGVGITLSIQEVQVIKPVEYTQGGSGFDAVEGGWEDTAEETTSQAPAVATQQVGDF